MSKHSLVERMLCAEARIDSRSLRTGYIQPQQWLDLTQAMAHLCGGAHRHRRQRRLHRPRDPRQGAALALRLVVLPGPRQPRLRADRHRLPAADAAARGGDGEPRAPRSARSRAA
ncbi:MAG: DnaB-like helicase C-terminal domain-containing protein [Marinilabiliales bacterium]|nr:DnaB-like helicase C-terminal domain-containing protein [Marinilabiliales bacterium]